MTPLRVHIERLVLDAPGFDPRSGEVLRASIESTLRELTGEPATGVPDNGSATAAGREAAIAIHRAVQR